MKKRYIVGIVIAVIIILVVLSFVAYYFIQKNAREYEIAKVENYQYFVLKENNLSGVIDRSGNILIEPTYEEIRIPNPEKAIFVCYAANDSKVLNQNNEELFSEYELVEPIRLKNVESDLMYEKSVLKYYQNGKYGLIDFEGKQITEPIYDSIDSLPYKEGELLVEQDGKIGVINIKGNLMVDISYGSIEVDGYYKDENKYKYAGYITSVTTNEGYRYGYVNYKGQKVLENEYNEISRINDIDDDENVYLISAKNGQYGVLKNKDQILNNEYQSIRYDGTNNLFVVEKSRKFGVADINGNIIIEPTYNQIDITGAYLYAQNEQGTTIFNSNGTEANINTNISILNTDNDKYKIRINNENGSKYGVINESGEQVISEKYNYIEYLYDNYFIVSNENSKLGVIDNKENEKVKIEYDSLQKIEGTDLIQTTISSTNVTELYDKSLNNICQMTNATLEVEDNYVVIYNDTETKYFDYQGKELTNKEVFPNNPLYAKQENGLWGFEKRDGTLVVECKYDKVAEFNEYGFAAVQKDGKWGAINSEGTEVIAPTYELDSIPNFIGQYYQVVYGFGEIYYTNGNLNA